MIDACGDGRHGFGGRGVVMVGRGLVGWDVVAALRVAGKDGTDGFRRGRPPCSGEYD